MAFDRDNLIWIDLEMTGLEPEADYIIEIATVITDKHLNVLEEGPTFAVYQRPEILDAMDDWNKEHHGKSGLIDRIRESKHDEAEAEAQTLAFLRRHVPEGASPMCGNSICQDRRFLARWMPDLEAYFHYRNLDVSTIKELTRRWAPQVADNFKKESTHVAIQDIHDSIAELVYYRREVLKI
ncbi:MAG: oligoribonuclease [Chromatiales bacterium]|nr:oligoribonuclease [Chromatiales bacterium]